MQNFRRRFEMMQHAATIDVIEFFQAECRQIGQGGVKKFDPVEAPGRGTATRDIERCGGNIYMDYFGVDRARAIGSPA